MPIWIKWLAAIALAVVATGFWAALAGHLNMPPLLMSVGIIAIGWGLIAWFRKTQQ